MTKKYIDVSEWQRNINYRELLENGIDGAMLRCGYTGYGPEKNKVEDALFSTHYEGMNGVGIPVGVYWYSCATSIYEAEEEAEKVLEIIKDKKIALPVAWDTENELWQQNLSKGRLTDCAIAFCEKIENAGYYAMIYASLSWFKDKLDLKKLTAYDKWVASWGNSFPYIDFGIWQYTSQGHVKGIDGNVDLNKSYKDYETLIASVGLNNLNR